MGGHHARDGARRSPPQLVAPGVDYLVVVRGAIFSAEKTRPDFHEPTGFNIDLCRDRARGVAAATSPVFLQGSVVDCGQAEWARSSDGGVRRRRDDPGPDRRPRPGGQAARRRAPTRIRPCIRCNQTCQVRDARNPIVTCVGEPTSGRETEDPDWYAPDHAPARRARGRRRRGRAGDGPGRGRRGATRARRRTRRPPRR